MRKIAYIYPGQGAQMAGMGADFYEKSEAARIVFDRASEILQMDIKTLCFEKNDKLDLTEYTQAALVTTCLAMTKAIEHVLPKPDMTAGLSLGEYCAIVAAGGMKVEDAIKTVRIRGLLMQNAVPAGKGSMAAVLGLDGETIEQVLEPISGVAIANYNCPGQIVITGMSASVIEASERLKEAGAKRVIPLNVSGPFHSPMMASAGEKLADVLKDVELRPLRIPYVTNVTAEPVTDIGETKALLTEQVSASVRWHQSMERMIEEGIDTFVEIRPGKTLSGFMRKINRNISMYQIQNWDDIELVVQSMKNNEKLLDN